MRTFVGLLVLGISSSAFAAYRHVTDWRSVESELPARPSCTVEVKKTITVKGTFDGKGCLYTWRGSGYPKKCHAPAELSETEPRMFVMTKGSKLRNMQIECSLDGILTAENTTIENIVFRDVEEDAITTKGNNIVIRNNKFFLCQDKCIQLNGPAKGVLIENNHFQHANRPMSGSSMSQGGATKIISRGNTCKNCEIMYRMQQNHDIIAENNYLEDGRDMLETVDQSVIYDCGRNVAKNARYKSPKSSGFFKSCPSSYKPTPSN